MLKPTLDPGSLVFLDESGVNLSMSRRYAWSERGEPAYGDVPVNRGPNQTLLAAVSLDGGLLAPMQITGGTTGDVFVAYVEHVLVPTLRPGDVVCLDNLSSHKVAGVQTQIEAAGASVLYLPRYSPEHNPVELMWAAVKRRLRHVGARTSETLDVAITAALGAVTAEDVRGWFRHCGYCA
jgi:transposase